MTDQTADLRFRYRFSTPDAVQIATALKRDATGFVENDKALKTVKEIEHLTMADLT